VLANRAAVILGLDPRNCGRAHVAEMVTIFPRHAMLGSSPSKTARDELTETDATQPIPASTCSFVGNDPVAFFE
jgi:hypothetical protein